MDSPSTWLVAGRITEGAVAGAVRLLRRLLDDLRVGGLDPLEGAVEVAGREVDARIGAFGHHLGDRAELVLRDAGSRFRRIQDDRGIGLISGADREPVHPAVLDVVADLEPEGVAIEGERRLWIVVREHGCVDVDVHGGDPRRGSAPALLDS